MDSRQIYEYPDGSLNLLRKADPAVLDRGLRSAAKAHGTGWLKLYERLRDVSKRIQEVEASQKYGTVEGVEITPLGDDDYDLLSDLQGQVADVVRCAFTIKAFDADTGTGLTEQEVMKVLYAFYDWLKKKEPSTDDTPLMSESMDSDLRDISKALSGEASITSSSMG